MPLTAASTLARRARHSRAVPSGSPGPLGAALVARHHQQQSRGFRFGRLWCSYLDQNFHRDLYRRHRSARYKYAETLNRRLSWEKPTLAEDAKSTLKRMVYNYWHPAHKTGQAGGRYMNTDASPRTPDNPDGVRPGQNIEDAERAPLEHLLFGSKTKRAKKAPRTGTGPGNPGTSSQVDTEYFIDPITNRKVARKAPPEDSYSTPDRGVEIPVRTFRPYKPQFAPFKAPEIEKTQAPIFYDGPPPEAELRKYGQIQLDAETSDSVGQSATKQTKSSAIAGSGASGFDFLDTLNWEHKEVSWHQNDGIASASSASATGSLASQSQAPEYPDLHKYHPVMGHDERVFDRPRTDGYKDLDKYTAFRYHEPDGKLPGQEDVNEYTDLDKYGAVTSHEPDGKYGIDEAVQQPGELSMHHAVKSHKPDGRYKLESNSADSQELSQYGAVRSDEPDGKNTSEPEPAADRQELSRYGAFRSHEPDGKYKVEEPPQEYDDLDKYGAFRSHEPDGKYAPCYAEPVLDAAELAHYSKPVLSHEPDGKYSANYVERRPDPAELAHYSKPFLSHEPDGKYAASYVEPKPHETELGKYQAFRSHEPDGKYAANHAPPAQDSAELATYGPFRSHEPDGKYAAEAASAKEAEDLGNHEAFGYEESESIPPYEETQPSRNALDLAGYKTVQLDEPLKSQSELAGEDYDGKEPRKQSAARVDESDGKHQSNGQKPFEYDPKGETPSEEKTPYRKMVEELMARSAAESDDAVAESLTLDRRSNEADSRGDQSQSRLTGNYVRDFPEEFTGSWAHESSDEHASLLPTSTEADEVRKSGQMEGSSVVQPALERFNKPRVEAKRGMDPSLSAESAKPAEPNLYKILVYDPTMQSIEVAETTSIVPDTAAPLTPAEVLLRISNPAKFFPHFAPLQAEGYEIVSGSGDVLIFRKVREASHGAQQPVKTGAMATEAAASYAAVNPIDKTGGRLDYTVAAGRFASPTGFVNYDLPLPSTAPAERFESGVNVRREEPVASGKKDELDKGEQKSLPKRVFVGAAWLAGVSYSLGVVSEYFKTGGQGGKGPKGL